MEVAGLAVEEVRAGEVRRTQLEGVVVVEVCLRRVEEAVLEARRLQAEEVEAVRLMLAAGVLVERWMLGGEAVVAHLTQAKEAQAAHRCSVVVAAQDLSTASSEVVARSMGAKEAQSR